MNNPMLNLFKQIQANENFDVIKVGLASPDKIRSWSHGEVKNRKPSTIARSNLNATACFARKFSAQSKTTNACAANTNV